MPIIPPETIEQIAAANDIVEVIGTYFPLKRAGIAYKALCPFHREKSPSFTVNPQRQIFKCFGCGAAGTVFRFVMDYEQVDFLTAARKLAERAGIRIVEQEVSAEDSARLTLRRRLLALHAEVADFFHHQLLKKKSAAIARDYLKGRGIGGDIARSWKLGYAPDSWEALTDFLRERRYEREEVAQSGLLKEREGGGFYDLFRNRVMFPICNDTGEVIGFSGRVLEADAKAAKYVNSPETMLFKKSEVFFGLHRSKRALIEAKSAIVMEGQLDLITAFEAGVQNVIAPQGTAFTERQAAILKRYVQEAILCFDADTAGENAAEKSARNLLVENLGIRVVEMPAGEDPDSLIRTRGADAFRERIAKAPDFFSVQMARMARMPEFQTARGRSAAASRVAEFVALIKDPIMRETVMSKVTMTLEISPAEFVKLVQPGKPAKRFRSVDPLDEKIQPARAPMDPTLKLLASVALQDEDARAWILEEEWRERLEGEAGSELIIRILEADIDPSNLASIQSFLTTLSGEDEAAAAALLEEPCPLQALAIACDCWRELDRRAVRREIAVKQARLRVPGLDDEEQTKLQKEILDRQKRLLDIAPPLSPPL